MDSNPFIDEDDRQELQCRVVYASSEDLAFRAKDLEANNTGFSVLRGWRSERHPKAPQELGLRFAEGVVSLEWLELHCPASKAPEKVQVFCSTVLSDPWLDRQRSSYSTSRYVFVGTLLPASYDGSSVVFRTPMGGRTTRYVRLLLGQSHVSSHNIHRQIGVFRTLFVGIPLEPVTLPPPESPPPAGESAAGPPTRAVRQLRRSATEGTLAGDTSKSLRNAASRNAAPGRSRGTKSVKSVKALVAAAAGGTNKAAPAPPPAMEGVEEGTVAVGAGRADAFLKRAVRMLESRRRRRVSGEVLTREIRMGYERMQAEERLKAVMREAEERRAAAAGTRALFTEVETAVAAEVFFEALGFREAGERAVAQAAQAAEDIAEAAAEAEEQIAEAAAAAAALVERERVNRGERTARTARGDKTARTERGDKTARTERGDKTARTAKGERPARSRRESGVYSRRESAVVSRRESAASGAEAEGGEVSGGSEGGRSSRGESPEESLEGRRGIRIVAPGEQAPESPGPGSPALAPAAGPSSPPLVSAPRSALFGTRRASAPSIPAVSPSPRPPAVPRMSLPSVLLPASPPSASALAQPPSPAKPASPQPPQATPAVRPHTSPALSSPAPAAAPLAKTPSPVVLPEAAPPSPTPLRPTTSPAAAPAPRPAAGPARPHTVDGAAGAGMRRSASGPAPLRIPSGPILPQGAKVIIHYGPPPVPRGPAGARASTAPAASGSGAGAARGGRGGLDEDPFPPPPLGEEAGGESSGSEGPPGAPGARESEEEGPEEGGRAAHRDILQALDWLDDDAARNERRAKEEARRARRLREEEETAAAAEAAAAEAAAAERSKVRFARRKSSAWTLRETVAELQRRFSAAATGAAARRHAVPARRQPQLATTFIAAVHKAQPPPEPARSRPGTSAGLPRPRSRAATAPVGAARAGPTGGGRAATAVGAGRAGREREAASRGRSRSPSSPGSRSPASPSPQRLHDAMVASPVVAWYMASDKGYAKACRGETAAVEGHVAQARRALLGEKPEEADARMFSRLNDRIAQQRRAARAASDPPPEPPPRKPTKRQRRAATAIQCAWRALRARLERRALAGRRQSEIFSARMLNLRLAPVASGAHSLTITAVPGAGGLLQRFAQGAEGDGTSSRLSSEEGTSCPASAAGSLRTGPAASLTLSVGGMPPLLAMPGAASASSRVVLTV